MATPGFWDDQQAAQKITRQIAALKAPIERYSALERRLSDAEVLAELGAEADDLDVAKEVAPEVDAIEQALQEMELQTLLNGKYDQNNAILTLHSGAGGTESNDWCEMLLRMYTRWAEHHGYKVEVLDLQPGDEAGVKSVTVLVNGLYAYGFLQVEKGVHRLVRISPFDASGRRHTSFASCDVMPEVEDDTEVEIRPEDLRVDTYRASGAGGQHINKTESAVRLTHLPTGVVVACQQERSQVQNREVAMRMLRSKLVELKLEAQQKELAGIRGPQMEIAWGSQIRSYVFQPYTLVKDHRTGVEAGNAQGVMDGDLDPFIYGYMQHAATKGSEA